MNVQAKSRDEYFAFVGEREPELRELDEFIQKEAPNLKPALSGGMTGMMLGYGEQPYQTKSMKEPAPWPVLALAAQKNYFSLYVMAVQDGKYMAEEYADELGKVSCGKSCIRFKKLSDLNLDGVKKILHEVDRRVKAGENLYNV